MNVRVVGALSFAICVVACGGRTEAGTYGDDKETSRRDAGTSDSGDPSKPSEVDGGERELGECIPGDPPGGDECPWLASDGLCYSSADAACDCVCPRRADSVCLSGFPAGPNGRSRVTCD